MHGPNDRHGNTGRVAGAGLRKRAILLYVLASSYAVGRLIIDITVSGTWGLNAEFFVHVAAVSFAQLGVLEILDRLLRRRTEAVVLLRVTPTDPT